MLRPRPRSRSRLLAGRLRRTLPALTLAGVVVLPACSSAGGDAPTAPGPTDPSAGFVRGTVVDAAGRPLAGVQVFADNTLYYNANAIGVTDAQGRYRVDVREPIGTWHVSARLERTYHGRTYEFDLHPDNDAAFPGVDGAVRNFEWRLSGATPTGDDYGARAYVYVNASADGTVHPAYSDVEVTFTPDGPLPDGSAGTPVTARLETFRVEDVPLGRYVVTADHAPAAGARRAMEVRVP